MAPSVGVFFSPPEPTKHESFCSTQSPLRQTQSSNSRADSDSRLPSIRSLLSPLSPPVSPATKPVLEPEADETYAPSRDPLLFPQRPEPALADTAQPLFRTAVDQHIDALDTRHAPQPRPSRDEYELAVYFRQRLVDRYNADPRAYIRKELEYLSTYPPRWTSSNSPVGTKRRLDMDLRTTKHSRTSVKTTVEKLPPPVKRIRASPRELPLDASDVEPPTKHRRKVSRTTPTPREDMDFRKIPDYSPPASTMLPGKNLKIDWKGHPLDLTDDPDRHLLDDAEVNLASVLRLSAAQYLFAKRRIFEKFIELARVGKDLNKTSAQAVCKIDVNKASKLWTAFEKVGWFDRKLFSQHLN